MWKVSTPLAQIIPTGVGGDESVASALARKAAAGDTQATVALLRSIRPSIVAVVRRIAGANAADVDDAVQQTLIGFIQALPAWRGEGEPLTYAKAIAVRSALAVRRRAHRASGRTEDECDASSLPSNHPSPGEDVMAERRRVLLRQLLREIPIEQAEALAMRVVLGWSLPDVAASSGVPLNTVRSRIRLAKEALRRKIEAAPELRDALQISELEE